MFDITVVKLAMFFLIVYISNKDLNIALITSIAVMVTIITINNYNTVDNIAEEFMNDYLENDKAKQVHNVDNINDCCLK